MDDLSNFLELLFWKAPVCVAVFAALVFAIARWERHPVASLWAALGFGWILVVTVADAAWRAFLVPELFEDHGPVSTGESLSYVFFSTLEAAGFVFLAIAVVIDRSARRHAFEIEDDFPYDKRH